MFKKNNKKKIIFEEATPAAKHILSMPKPATHSVPDWYKNQKIFTNNQNNLLKTRIEKAGATYKLCVPLVDSMTSGYYFVTPCDIVVTNKLGDKYNPEIEWGVNWSPLDVQDPLVLGNFPFPVGHSKVSFRWITDWKIITPKGYSLWITHPSQRFDLPFTTMTAFVDTDKFPNKLLLPFFIKEGFEGIIPEGTPIAQIIPVKRDLWISEKGLYKEGTDFIFENIIKTKIIRGYKNKFWTKKEYR
jgi:hypothetical protein